jgi:hypothetical protein
MVAVGVEVEVGVSVASIGSSVVKAGEQAPRDTRDRIARIDNQNW